MTAKNINNAYRLTEKVMDRLQDQFIEFLKTATSEGLICEKIQDLNDKWLEHIDRTPEMQGKGKNEFLRVAGMIMVDVKKIHAEEEAKIPTQE